MNIKPLGDRILVKRLESETSQSGHIIIPDTAREKPQQGEVVAVGTGKLDKNGKRVPLSFKKGDKVLFGKYSGDEWEMDGEAYLFLSEDEVLAIL
ncbi:MAG: co-chaperone GroES [Calditrichaeota bacterium]|nr:MAG: co-chaperone GroES [Calditrichota bacterium]